METVGTKNCSKCDKEGQYGHPNTKDNNFHLYRKSKRGPGPKAYETVCKICRGAQMHAYQLRVKEKKQKILMQA
jgi:cytochrome c5